MAVPDPVSPCSSSSVFWTECLVRKHKVAANAKRKQNVAVGAKMAEGRGQSATASAALGMRSGEYRARFLGIHSRTAGD